MKILNSRRFTAFGKVSLNIEACTISDGNNNTLKTIEAIIERLPKMARLETEGKIKIVAAV